MQTQTLQSRVIKTEPVKWRDLQFIQQDEFKEWVRQGDKKLYASLLRYQFIDPFKVWEDAGVIYCLDGYHRYRDLLVMENEGIEVPDQLPANFIHCADKKEAAELVLVFSSRYASITKEGLQGFVAMYDINPDDLKMNISLPEFDSLEFDQMFSPTLKEEQEKAISLSLQERFIMPPFSVLDTRQGYWQDRKKKWHFLFDSQATREEVDLIAISGQGTAIYDLRNKMREALKREPTWEEIIEYAREKDLHIYEGGSVFDPVLSEILYAWFCPEKGTVLDPFAGGSVRGIVAGIKGLQYLGIDLRQEQVDANLKQKADLVTKLSRDLFNVHWMTGNSLNLDTLLSEKAYCDFLFSCPPYHDLEKYSDDPEDLSNMSYLEFFTAYRTIIDKSVARLKNDRFACFVVGDIRDKNGMYRNFVSDTIDAFLDAGMQLYNEMILVNVAGSLPIRLNRQFGKYRKVGKMHQNVLIFYKGDPKNIPANFPEMITDDKEGLLLPAGAEQL